MAIVFSTYFDRIDNSKKKHKTFFTNSGTKFVPTYEYQIIDGIKTLVNCGEKDLDAEIQSHAAESDIHNILVRFLNGDDSVFNKVVGTFGDFTDCPNSYAEMFSRIQQCENLFNSLPVDLKDKFDNSYQKFWSDFGSESFDKIITDYSSSINNNVNDVKDGISVVEKGESINAE